MIGEKTKIIADWIESLNYNDIPNKVINHIKMCILDSLGVGIYGSTLPWTKILMDVVEDMRGKKEATIYGALKLKPLQSRKQWQILYQLRLLKWNKLIIMVFILI